jgi:hypothetical protein
VVRDCGAVQQGGQQQVQNDVYLPYAEASALAIVVFDGQPTPAKWKTFLLTWIAVYPTRLLIMYLLGALVPNLWRPIQLAISSLLFVSSLTWRNADPVV